MGEASTFDDGARRCLIRLIQRAFPHATFPEGPYARTADVILAHADDATADAIVAKATDAPFFALVRATTVVTLYNDAEVWKLIGYEGASFDQGGYLHRGFDDLDWLPDPRTAEYDGPDTLVVVAAGDEPAGTEGVR